MKSWKEIAQSARQAETGVRRTLVEILGMDRVLVEQHRGIVGYGEEEILVNASFGLVRILGRELRLCCMSREQLVIRGRIGSVILEGGRG